MTTGDGTVIETPAASFLQADTSQFVPLNPDGSRAYGQFIRVNENGLLDRFLFFPEGLGDAALVTGAHFEFPDGASLRNLIGSTGLEFSSVRFFRGHQDSAPVVATSGTRTLDIDGATASSVATVLGLPGGARLDVLWNELPLEWVGGALSEAGWAALNVRPPIGDFLLPNTHECSLVSFDARTGDPTLIFCYHGQWTPFPGGPQFRIPPGEPLKIYLSFSGRIAGHGTVESTFPDGATVRGSVSWREPNFEVRLQGRNIVIPALASLMRALPANPELCLPAGNSTAELDAAAKCLASFRDTYRALAMGGQAESSLTGGETLAPLTAPTDPSGTALGAWAARLASWAADRAGQTLDTQMIEDLRRTVLNAAKTGESAHDLPTVLKFLRDVMVLRQQQSGPLGSGAAADDLRARIQDAESRLLAAAERVIGETGGFEASPEFAEIVTLLGSAASVESGGAGFQAAQGSSRLQQLINAARAKIGPKFAGRVSQAALNQGLASLSSRELIGFLEELAVYYELLTFPGGTPQPGAPTLQQVLQAAQNIRPHFATKSDTAAGAANTPADYFKLRDVLQERTRFFVLNDRLGLKLSSTAGNFFFQTPGLVQNLVETFKSLPLAGKARACRDLEFFSALIAHTSDNGADAGIAEADALVQNCNALTADALASASQASRCDDLAQALMKERFTIARRDPAQEGAAFPDVTGLYESVEDGTESYVTLQLNQGGRYLQGGMQLQVQDTEGRSARYIMWNLQGLFLRQTTQPGVMEFACRLINVVDGNTKFALATSRPDGQGGFMVQIGAVTFTQRSPSGRFSAPILVAFESGQRRSITASQQTPMHTRITARTITDAASLRITLDQYFSDAAGPAAEQAAAAEIQNKLNRIDRRLTSGQRPIAAALLRRVLTSITPVSVKESKITGNVTDIGNKTMLYWDLLLAVTLRQNLDLAAPLGMTPAQFQEIQSSLGADNFRYELTVRQASGTVGELFLTFGGGELDVTVKKFSPGGQLLATFDLIGFMASWSPGIGVPLPLSCSITTNNYRFDSPLSFVAADFTGPLDFAQFGVNAAAPPGALPVQLELIKLAAGINPSVNSWSIGYFSVYGSGRFPTMTFKTTPQEGFSVNGCLANVGVGVDIGGGRLTATEPPDDQSILFNPGQTVSFDVSAHPDLDGGVFFEINGSTLTECGWQYLRTFVAEHHELLTGAKSKIRVEGHTDAPGSGAFNQQLSEARANSVKNALIGLLGASLRTTVAAEGRGESEHDAALNISTEAPAPNDALFRRADIIVGGVVKATLGAPATPQP